MRNLLFLLIVFLFFYSCGNQKTSYSDLSGDVSYEMAADEEIVPITRQLSEPPPPPTPPAEESNTYNKKIIKDARIGVKVDDYNLYRPTLDSTIAKLNGYISNDDLQKDDRNIYCNVTIRIPADNFEKLVGSVEKGTSKLMYKNISARDVTEEFVDIEARLKTKKEVEKRYVELLSKARNVKEILEVEEQLRVIREEIESKEGRLKYLNSQVSYSTVYLNIVQELEYKYQPEKEKSFFQRLWKSLDRGWKGLIIFVLFLFRIWPVILIGVAIFLYIRKIRKNRKKKSKN